jgi:nucleotide-binding universal stress UspA family protein
MEVAVELPLASGVARYCSLRCAEAAEAAGTQPPAAPTLPELPRRILVAVDGSGPSLRAAELAAALARAAHGSVVLLHAVDPRWLRQLPAGTALAARLGLRADELEHELREDAEAQLERCRRVCESAAVPVSVRVELEAPARAIAEAAEKADLVVIGSRGLGALGGAALGSLSHRVLGVTRKPVLVVH